MNFRFDDKLTIPTSRRIQATGQMIAECAIARTGVLLYRAGELGSMFEDRNPTDVIRVAQLSDDLFSEETLEKFRSAPITIGHPQEDVDTKNMKELGKGTLEGKPHQEGDHLSASLVLSDEEAIELVNAGVSELSVRAYYTLHRVDDSLTHDAVRRIKTVNHIAIVDKGRAGITCRISDSEDGGVVVIQEVEDNVLPVEEPIVEEPVVVEPIIEEPVVEEDTQLSDALSEIEVLKAKLDDALSKVLTQEQLDAKVEDAIKFRMEVSQLSDIKVVGKTQDEVKREIVSAKTGLSLSDASPEYINARFQILVEDRETETPMAAVLRQSSVQTQALSDNSVHQKSPAELAYDRMVARNNHSI